MKNSELSPSKRGALGLQKIPSPPLIYALGFGKIPRRAWRQDSKDYFLACFAPPAFYIIKYIVIHSLLLRFCEPQKISF